MFICLGVDDCVNIEGLESMLDIVETLDAAGSKAVFTMWVAPLAGDEETRDLVKQKLLQQRLFDQGCEIAHHTLNHNPGGRNWASLPREVQVREIEGCTEWYRRNIDGFTRPFTHKGGGGGRGAPIDREFTRALRARQNFLYRGRRGGHPDTQGWPTRAEGYWSVPTGALDGNAPPVHEKITRAIHSDYPGQFDYELDQGVAMMVANFDHHWRLPHRPIFAVNAYHDWGFKTRDDSTAKYSHRNEAAILKEFLLEVLVRQKDRYPDTHCVTFRQVVEYAASEGDLEHTLAAGNCQDSRNPQKPLIP
jgi:peptidoglycan/xylan/chitin deacetylase (PgdA/CDA1 family)